MDSVPELKRFGEVESEGKDKKYSPKVFGRVKSTSKKPGTGIPSPKRIGLSTGKDKKVSTARNGQRHSEPGTTQISSSPILMW